MKKAGDFEKTQPMSQHLKVKTSGEKKSLSHSNTQLSLTNLEKTITSENYWQNIQEIVRSSFLQTVGIIKELQ